MDINNISFGPMLLGIIEQISTAHFVSFDLEMSGITSKPPANRRKQTLQERYIEVKEAAEKYAILQIGITCVEEYDGIYVLRPYNFYLSPMITEDLEIERIWSYQEGAVKFLLNHGFDMSAPFTRGVEYLSRHEEKLARLQLKNKLDKSKFDHDILVTDDANIEFLDKVRGEINKWVKMGNFGELLIVDRKINANAKPKMLTSFDRRLVHQLVRAEYPQFMTIARDNTVVIKLLDAEREKRYQEGKMGQLKQKISQQTGFRWVFEALCGGNFNGIDYTMFAKDPATGESRFCDIDDYSARLNRAKQCLQRRKPPLVGHNVFQDLVYLYKTFVGTLPPTVSEFCTLLHQMFPTIVDTKYLATHNCGDLNPSSSLGEIEAELRPLRTPEIILHSYHRKYRDEAPHEAGYDSYLTARVMIQLSTKLEALGTYSMDGVPPVDGHANHNFVSNLTWLSSISSIGGCMPNDQDLRPLRLWTLRGNTFAQIQNIGRNMPPFMSDFWRVYGNKLRAFGTVERLINLVDYDLSPEDAIRVRMYSATKFLGHSCLTTDLRVRFGICSL